MHVPFANWLIRAAVPEVLVELGTLTGVSYSAFCDAVVKAGLPTRCHAVKARCSDRHLGETGDEVYGDFRRFHDSHYNAFSILLRCTFDAALEQFADGSIDLLHFDASCTYETARHDLEGWLPKLSKRGIVLLHRTNVRDGDFGVSRFWQELRGRYPNFEFVHGHGLGILAVGEAAPSAVLAMCRLTDPAAVARLRSRFTLIGERWSQLERLEASESALARAQTDSQEARSQIAALESAMQVRIASLQSEVVRLETMVTDRAMAAEMAENVAALKAGELQRTRAEIAALTTRISSSSRIKGLCREAARLLGSLKPHVTPLPVSASGTTAEDPDRRS